MTDKDVDVRHDLLIIGTGSGNTIVDDEFEGWSVGIVERRTFGGTCLNRGCIPSKMFIYPADTVRRAEDGPDLGVDTSFDQARWPEIRDRIFRRIDDNARSGRDGRQDEDHVSVYEGTARFVGPRTVEVELADRTVRIAAERVVIAAGSRPVVPDIEGLDEPATPRTPPPGEPDVGASADGRTPQLYTSDNVMRMPEQPRRLAILGGGYIGAEFAHVFAGYGTTVTQIDVADTLVSNQDRELAEMFTRFARRRWDVRTEADLVRVERAEDGLRLHLHPSEGAEGAPSVIEVDALLVAVGRVPAGDGLDLGAAGIEVDDDGLVVVDVHQATSADGVWALGDISSTTPLKHSANHDARVVRHNLLHPDDPVESDHTWVPNAVFADPQIASVGATEREARDRGLDVVTARQGFGDVAYGWAMEDDGLPDELEHLVKLVADRERGTLVGAHILGPQASILVQPLVDACVRGEQVAGLARRTWWIHPALTEVVEQALLALERELVGDA